MRTIMITALLLGSTALAHAGGQADSLGIGAETQLSGISGLSADYDVGKFNVGGLLGLRDPSGPSNTELYLGGHFFYHIASTATSDFSVGGALGIASVPARVPTPTHDRDFDLFLEPGFQIRAFIATNVALTFTGGLTLGVADAANNVVVDGQVTGSAGVHYYFY
jgi:hypothetical protein